MLIKYEWRGAFANDEAHALHAEAFGTPLYDESQWNWVALTGQHSLGWVTARSPESRGALIGFVNVVWDGFVHAWLQDVMVARPARRHGVGIGVVAVARHEAGAAGCEFLHVDFDDHLVPFYIDACGFTPTRAGLLRLL